LCHSGKAAIMGETIHLVNDKIEKFHIFIAFIFIDFDMVLYMS